MEKIVWNRVTWYSKWLALFFFVFVFPTWCFYIGEQYGEAKAFLSIPQPIPIFLPVKATTTPSTVATTTPTMKEATVTLLENGKTIHVKKGQRILLKLGTEYDWNISITDSNIISRVKNIAMILGAQGLYTADKVGKTIIAVTGLPVCTPPGGVCRTNIISFTVTIVVDPS